MGHRGAKRLPRMGQNLFLGALTIVCYGSLASNLQHEAGGGRSGSVALAVTATQIEPADGQDATAGVESPFSQHPVVQGATDVLMANYRDNLQATIPSSLIDAHQESITSVLAAHAWAHVDQHRARSEMLSIFLGQWDNGLIPTVRYAAGYSEEYLRGSFLPGPQGWGNNTPAVSARGSNTSSLAALPVHAEAALRIFDLSPRGASARLWLQALFPPLFRYHDYLHAHRMAPETGLVYVYHPWETEILPDSAVWPDLLRETRARMANESWTPPAVPDEVSSVPGFPGEEAYGAATYLADCSARYGRHDETVQRECPFLLQDVQFNAALVRSDKALLELADILEATRSGWQSKVYTPEQYQRLQGWAARADSGTAMKNIWSSEDGAFLSRYTSAVTSEDYFVRPVSSSSFSGLSAPAMEVIHSNAALKILLSPGPLSFRCGNHPIPDVECGYNSTSTSIMNSDTGDEIYSQDETTATAGKQREEDGMRAPAAADSGRVSVFHNLMAKRGFAREGFLGIAGWLANSTLPLFVSNIADTESSQKAFVTRPNGGTIIADAQTTAHHFRSLSGSHVDRIRRWAKAELSTSEHSTLMPSEFDTRLGVYFSDSGRNHPDSLRPPVVVGAGEEGGRDEKQLIFSFCRNFDAESGLPVQDAEGNTSSLAAAAFVLLLLGDGPEGGNDFPPITHATLFILMAIELAFSFAVGVSCLVFSINLVRKLRDDHPDNITAAGDDSVARSGAGRYNSNVIRGDDSFGRAEDTAARRLGGAGIGNVEEYTRGVRAAGSGGKRVGTSQSRLSMGRGIGSLLPRNASAHREMYRHGSGIDDEDDGGGSAGESVERAVGARDQRRQEDGDDDVEWRLADSGDDYEEGSRPYDDDDERGRWGDSGGRKGRERSRRHSRRRSQRRRVRSQPPPPTTGAGLPEGTDPHYYHTLPADNDLVEGAANGVPRSQPWGGGPLQEIPPCRTTHSRGGSDVSDEGREDRVGGSAGGGGGGLLDILKPFYASLKPW